MKNIAIFASGSGSDMQSVIDGTLSGQIDGRVVAVVVNKEGIFAIERAKKHGIDCKIFKAKDYVDMAQRDSAIVEYLKGYGVDLIVLAGYLAIITPVLVDAYEGRIINIHPSLIPKHCGKGMYGLNVHRSVIASGDKESGCTVHFVDYGADTGEIIAQDKVEVKEDDTPESLQARVLEREHILLPQIVAKLCNR
ncbi:MAG: phosphoribosylglycinamide formyltransferase [Clostridia bacterium]|nr:phosphoribosylglycinamide formyltransferase [Clostridia bacterium]MCI8944504.1 phosphoribosylglycinamide formyltransferase [Clostridia bacterium]